MCTIAILAKTFNWTLVGQHLRSVICFIHLLPTLPELFLASRGYCHLPILVDSDSKDLPQLRLLLRTHRLLVL